ncbi:MAG: DUF4252 domain-containing protein [Massilibacteroides sp.]|nr:DUF4252 domain-containing protein [Massilibacteroides sp.]MDD3063719.1 DUF4252 domain-containing protein [Massilibacteroides sp.]MDD4115054.1 DUF4252 domain-containing protein [Massilibacteroides sp.]MDD4659674.1 DUF4252 domain-containing protein [Massilibacteroides sp.]
MKTKYSLLVLFLFCYGLTFAQKNLFDKFADMNNVSSVYISKAMFQMMPDMQTGGLNLMNMKGKIESLQILTTENKEQADQMRKDFSALINKQHEELMRVKDGKTNATFYARKKGELISELIMLANTEKGFTVIQLLGNFTLKDVQNITASMKK